MGDSQQKFTRDNRKNIEKQQNKEKSDLRMDDDGDIDIIAGGDPNLSPDAGKPMV